MTQSLRSLAPTWCWALISFLVWENILTLGVLTPVPLLPGIPELTRLGVPSSSTSVPSLIYANLDHSLQQREGVAGMPHVLNPNVAWETLIDESVGHPISTEDKARGI